MDDASLNVSGMDKDKLAAIGPMLQGAVDDNVIAGAVSLIWRKGQIAHVSATGWRDIEAKAPMQRDTLFRIASMTKPIACVAALMLMEEGKLKLDDPITKWAPEFANMQVLKDPEGAVEDTVPATRDITIEDLMTHRSGLAYGFTSTGPIADAHNRALGDVLNSALDPDVWMKALGELPLTFQPGTRFHYSHSNDVLGFLVGRIEGKPFRDVLMEKIFRPLGMLDTDFYFPPEKRDRAAVVYRVNAECKLEPVPMALFDTPPAFAGGGGGLISCVDDYLKFARAMMNGGELDGVRLLKPETVALMAKNWLTDDQRAHPFFGFPFWLGQGYGLGVSVIVDAEKHAWMGPSTNGAYGWFGIFGTSWRNDVAKDMIVLYMVQNSVTLEAVSTDEAVNAQRMRAQMTSAAFQQMVYGAVEG